MEEQMVLMGGPDGVSGILALVLHLLHFRVTVPVLCQAQRGGIRSSFSFSNISLLSKGQGRQTFYWAWDPNSQSSLRHALRLTQSDRSYCYSSSLDACFLLLIPQT